MLNFSVQENVWTGPMLNNGHVHDVSTKNAGNSTISIENTVNCPEIPSNFPRICPEILTQFLDSVHEREQGKFPIENLYTSQKMGSELVVKCS